MSFGKKNSEEKEQTAIDIDSIGSVPIRIQAILGRTNMTIGQVLKLKRGAIIELDTKAGDPIEVVANDVPIATGEVTLIENSIGITLTEITRNSAD